MDFMSEKFQNKSFGGVVFRYFITWFIDFSLLFYLVKTELDLFLFEK